MWCVAAFGQNGRRNGLRRALGPVAILLALLSGPSSAQQKPESIEPFPGGATAITETHGDWTVSCEAKVYGRSCVALQTLGTKESRQPILAIEAAARPLSAANVLLTLPFGLDLRKGIELDLDGHVLASSVPFSGCTGRGCLVSIDLRPNEVQLLTRAKTLRLHASPAEDEKPLTFTISLAGFGSAFDRARNLVN